MKRFSMSEILELSLSERILLVEDIWDSIAAIPAALSLSAQQREELDRRLEDYHQNPGRGSPWPEVKARLLAKQ